MTPPRDPSDRSDAEWAILAPLIPPAKPGGHPRCVEMRPILNALSYQQRTGCQWRALPHAYPPWPTVWTYFWQWRQTSSAARGSLAMMRLMTKRLARSSSA